MAGCVEAVLFDAGDKPLVMGVQSGDLAILLVDLEPHHGEGDNDGDDDHGGHGASSVLAARWRGRDLCRRLPLLDQSKQGICHAPWLDNLSNYEITSPMQAHLARLSVEDLTP